MSYNIAMSGLRSTSQELNTISNNIANVSTAGYRGARSEFAAVYNGGEANGVTMSGASQNFALGGSMTYTGRELDMGIQGEGFFVMNASDGSTLYSRAGMFNQDADGNIVDPYGNKLQGYPVGADGQLMTGNVGDLQVTSGSVPASATSKVNMTANLDSRVTAINPATTPFNASDVSTYHSSNTVTVFDSQGNEHALTQYYVKTADNAWNVHYSMDGTTLADTSAMTFDTDGKLTAGGTDSLTIPAGTGASDMTIELAWNNTTQYGADYITSSIDQNGNTSGELVGVRVDESGKVYGTYTNGEEQLQGQVVLANFTNPNGLEPVNNTAWTATQAAGAPVVGAPGNGTLGSVSSGYIEGSNVDLTAEMVNLMTAQRNYQSNAKVLTTADTMNQALLNAI
ncbi:flagellar hook protein FlgE [Ferrimonas aestuarii]|uniref:Flagellar hook protein FlgE n=1 Tax=Ferrimonas aestuarii TaxID=2569539 RepID=A0A4U1BM86_9GAMM|nr:flagellar hook protein FlgE [Ferrimonas aestuarii]TKB54581.1 flagellar basal body protein FlaE [Ferrimonas aestuarii]